MIIEKAENYGFVIKDSSGKVTGLMQSMSATRRVEGMTDLTMNFTLLNEALPDLFSDMRSGDTQILQGRVTVAKVKEAEEHRKLGIL